MVIAVFQSQSGSTDTIHVEIVTNFCGLHYDSRWYEQGYLHCMWYDPV
jgi:hypothetical protein